MTSMAIPNIGNYTIALATAVQSLGIKAWASTATTPEALRLGIEAAPESVCLPLKAHLGHSVAKWWLPDAVEFVSEIPHGGTGKISKKDLREQFRDYKLADA